MLLLSKEDIKKVFTMKDAVAAVKEAFMIFSQGKSVVPLRTQIPAPKREGVFLFMPAYAEELDIASVKIVNIFPKNAASDLPTAPAQVLLIDGETGIVRSILDGTLLTQMRTGAATGAAFDVLGRKDAKIGAMIGTGSQARMQLEAMLTVRSLDEVRIYSRNEEKKEHFAKEMQQELKHYGTKIVAAKTSDGAIEEADLIVAVTSASSPVLDGMKVKKGATLSFVGSYQPHMQEMPPEILERASKIYFDSKEAVLSEAGDILIPLDEGRITGEDLSGDLGEVLLGRESARENNEEIIVFKTVGIGTQDLVTAKHIYEKASREKVGTLWGE
ncbi:MAG: ornithine cyclodeaminase family protein [Peptostreptococcaceae bacterium]|nr:ornithine cyclodeaminase family protein [Peptostreptococcaceae bacterium]